MMRLTAVLALGAVLAAPARAVNDQAGTSGAQFLKLGAGARAGAMADAFAARADDAYAAYYNPAGLTQLTGSQLAGAHTAYFQGVSYEVLGFAYPFGRQAEYSSHALAFGIYNLSVADIERRASDTTDPIGSFGASDGAYAVSYAYAPDRKLSLGVTGKYITQTLDGYKASAMAADAGILYQLNPTAQRPVRVAAALKNVGTRSGYVSGQSDPLPTGVTLGLAASPFKRLSLELDGTKYRDTNAFLAAGGEYTVPFNEAVAGALRFGYSAQRKDLSGLNGLTLGGGLTFHKAAFDFAWVPFGVLGDTFRYSLIIKF